MAWELEIHTIDVAQGESALVIAKDTVAGNFRSMLIDAGLQKYGQIVDSYVAGVLGNRQLDYIVTSHYDVDHSGGITQLLLSDNYSTIAYNIADAVYGEVSAFLTSDNKAIIGKAIGAFVGYTGGGYNDGVTDGTTAFDQAVLIAFLDAKEQASLQQARTVAYTEAKSSINNPDTDVSRPLLKYYGSSKPKTIAFGVANLVINNKGSGDLRTLLYEFIFKEIIPNNKGIVNTRIGTTTGFRYSNVAIYDPGNQDIDGTGYPISSVSAYEGALEGNAKIAGYSSKSIPAAGRTRTTPTLGGEMLGWGATAAAPHVYCLAWGRGVYQNSTRITQDNGNGISIGMAIQFGKFAFFTGGDLPADGLQMMPGALLNKAMFGNLTIIPAFKAGHHGSAHAINQTFLTAARPLTSVISAGYKQFGSDPNNVHPDQMTIDLLHGQATIPRFFLTNCKIVRNHVPGSDNKEQMVIGNKSRISGDNGYDPGERDGQRAKVERGNIVLAINQAESTSTKRRGVDTLTGTEVYRQFRMTHFEEDPDLNDEPLGPTTNTIFFWQ